MILSAALRLYHYRTHLPYGLLHFMYSLILLGHLLYEHVSLYTSSFGLLHRRKAYSGQLLATASASL